MALADIEEREYFFLLFVFFNFSAFRAEQKNKIHKVAVFPWVQ